MRATTLIFGSVMLALAAMGCGDDDSTGGGRDSGPTGIDSPTGTDTGPPGMCANADDGAALMAMYTVDGMMQDVPAITRSCAIGCISEPKAMQEMCVRDCINEDTMDAISGGCIDCLLVGLVCARESMCASRCLSDSPDCTACQCGDNDMDRNCRMEFTTCSGVVTSTCPMM